MVKACRGQRGICMVGLIYVYFIDISQGVYVGCRRDGDQTRPRCCGVDRHPILVSDGLMMDTATYMSRIRTTYRWRTGFR